MSAFHPEGGHIVRLLDVTEEGLLLDDPNGELQDGAKREKNGGNYNTNNSNDDIGSQNIWLWNNITGEHNSKTQEETFWIKYVVILKN
jgi:hypothetical protein